MDFNLFKSTKAAMFGLDARIALAIFGALSVISGAALYTAIQESKTVAMVQTMEEILKAVEQYMLDTGVDITSAVGHDNYLDIDDLLEDPGVDGWDGPYLAWEAANVTASGVKIVYYPYGGLDSDVDVYYALHKQDPTWTSGSEDCSSGEPCLYFLRAVIDNDLASNIDEYVDGESGVYEGAIRITTHSSGRANMYMKGPRLLSQP